MASKNKKKVEVISVFTPDDMVKQRTLAWLDPFASTLDSVKEEYPNVPIYEYRLVAVHMPPDNSQYTREEVK